MCHPHSVTFAKLRDSADQHRNRFHSRHRFCAQSSGGGCGVVHGTVREFTGEVQTQALEYEAYAEMAESSMSQLAEEARGRWPLIDVSIVHRSGHLELGDIAVAVAVSAGHRREAFEAGQWLIDTLKERTPIWKKEHYADGETEWIHPSGSEAGQ